jgi:hypothetical protein
VIGEKLHYDLAQSISDTCDRALAELAPVQCVTTGWTPPPVSAVTEK